MSEGTKTATTSDVDQAVESQTSLKKSLLAQVMEKELSSTSSSSTIENKKPMLPTFSLDFGKKKNEANGKEATSTTASKSEIPGGFIFGSRLSEKVTNADTSKVDDTPKDASSIFKQFSSNTSGGSFFKLNPSDGTFLKPFGDSSQIRSFSAASNPNSSDQIETITGEEGEKNLLHVSCKFYIFDRETKAWLERGMGTLRINEKIGATHEYRIATGNQRVCINSKIFPEMLLEKMTEKRLKLSALCPDSEAPQLFVVNGTPAAIASVQQQLEVLVRRVKNQANRKRPLESDASKEPIIPAKQKEKNESKSSNEENSDKEESDDADSKNDEDSK